MFLRLFATGDEVDMLQLCRVGRTASITRSGTDWPGWYRVLVGGGSIVESTGVQSVVLVWSMRGGWWMARGDASGLAMVLW